ncbi:MAG: hypothetical protein NC217_05375 [Muribaculaceae bacterium]|nr:hypothetical protein [Muribaculaceae bacterium]
MKTTECRKRPQLICAIAMLCLGTGLLIAAFILPPPGEIHSSVLVAFGETLTFAGALLGIDWSYKMKHN